MAEQVQIKELRLDGKTQIRVELSQDAVADYAAAMERGEQLPPILVLRDADGLLWLADGFHRVEATRRNGGEAIAAEVQSGTRREAFVAALEANRKHGVRLTNADKHKIVAELLHDEEWRLLSDHQLAAMAGTSQPFVSKKRRELSTDGFQSPSVRVAKDGRTIETAKIGRKAEKELEPAQASQAEPVELPGFELVWSQSELERKAQVLGGKAVLANQKKDKALLNWAKEQGLLLHIDQGVFANPLETVERFAEHLKGNEAILAKLPELQGKVLACWCHPEPCHGEVLIKAYRKTTSNEQYTPPEVLEAVQRVLGKIELDPCSNTGEPNVPAARHFTIEDNGLEQDWRASTLFLNPPFSEKAPWVEKLIEEHQAGHVGEAIVLLTASTSAEWWRKLTDASPVVCFTSKRVAFINPENESSARFETALFYLGNRTAEFRREFQEIGECWQKLKPLESTENVFSGQKPEQLTGQDLAKWLKKTGLSLRKAGEVLGIHFTVVGTQRKRGAEPLTDAMAAALAKQLEQES